MDIAVSMYLGGKEINASNPKLKTDSYRELGLKCAYCGEPVFHKNGYYNKAHFSHFPSIDPRKYEECLIRQKSVTGFSFSDNPWWENDGKAQRFELFQKHFFYILKANFPDIEFSGGFDNPQDIDLNDLQSQALTIATQNRSGIERYLRIFGERFTDIEIRIIAEVLDYITRSSSKNIFHSISEYAIKKLLKSKAVLKNDKLDPEDLYCEIINLIGSISWLEILARITDVDIEKLPKGNSAERVNIILRKIDNQIDGRNSCIYFDKSTICIANIGRYRVEHEVQLLRIDMRRALSSLWLFYRKKMPIYVSRDLDLFKIIRQNEDLFDEAVKRRLTARIRESINAYIENMESLEISFWKSDLGGVFLDETVEDFLASKKSKVILTSRKYHQKEIASISLNESSIRYQNYGFDDDCVKVTDEYRHLLREGNFEVEKAVVELLKEVQSILKI